MSEGLYRAVGQARTGFVEAPAGCGKTEAIVRSVAHHCSGRQLVLTHTHAGVEALRRRFRLYQVKSSQYHVDTIAGWAWSWVRQYPNNAGYQMSSPYPDWTAVYPAMARLLQVEFVRSVIQNSYTGVLVDEYQDCTMSMHLLLIALKDVVPCRVFGDDLQGIFSFGEENLVAWSDVKSAFVNDLGVLDEPHRWTKAGSEGLGKWLLRVRGSIRSRQEPTYAGSPVIHQMVSQRDVTKTLISLSKKADGRLCIVGPKARPLPPAVETALSNIKFRILEPNELSVLRDLIVAISDVQTATVNKAILRFFARSFGGVDQADKAFFTKLVNKQPQSPTRYDRRTLSEQYSAWPLAQRLLALIGYIEAQPKTVCKRRDSVSALKIILEQNLAEEVPVSVAYANNVASRKFLDRSAVYRCAGSTLLVKGLEFDHVVVLRSADWQRSWGTHNDLYVALTRGSKSVTLLDIEDPT